MRKLPGPKFFARAHRLFAYQGVMCARLRAEENGPSGMPAGHAPPRGDVERVAGTRAALEAHPMISGMIEFG